MSALNHLSLPAPNPAFRTSAFSIRNPVLKLVMIYVLVSGLWIWLSDRLVETLVHDTHLFHHVQTYKGWFFVVATGVLLGLIMRRDLGRIEQSETVARARETHLRLAAAAGDIGFWEWDFETGRLVWDDQMKAIFGLAPETGGLMLGDFEDRIHPEDREATRLACRQALEEGADYEAEFRILRPDGGVRWIVSRGRAECDRAGKTARMIGAALDLTEHKRAEQQRIDALNYAQTIIETSPLGIITYKASGETMSANQAVARIFGATLDQIKAQNFRHLDSWRQHGLLAAAEMAFATGQEQQLETEVVSSFGKQLRLNLRFLPFRYGGEPHLLTLITDVTAQRLGEETLRRMTETLQAIIDSSPAAIFDIGTDGRVRSIWNPGAEEMFGWTHAEAMGRTLPIMPDTKMAESATVRQHALAGEAFKNFEVRRRKRNGTPIDLNLSTAPLTDLAGRVTGMVAVAIDITKRKHTEAQLQQQAKALRDLSARVLRLQDEERRHLARELHDTSAQHIAALALSLAALQKSIPPDNPRAESLCKDARMLADTTAQEIRTMSYLLHPPLLDAVGLAGAIREYASGFAQRSGIHVDVDAPDESIRLSRDAELALFRICQEGLANIHRHSGSTRVAIRLAFGASSANLEIQDAGNGIPAEKLMLIKEMKAALGVGIAGMRERMRQLGGHLEIQSGPEGTIVRATLPVEETIKRA